MAADDLVHEPSRNSAEEDDPLRRVRLEKLVALRDMGIEPYPVTFSRTAEAAEASLYRLLREADWRPTIVSVGHHGTLRRFHEAIVDLGRPPVSHAAAAGN